MNAKRTAILEEAATLFLRKGYQATSMDEVAARAAVSKQTVYKQFSDKEKLFGEIVLANAETAAGFSAGVRARLAGITDLDAGLAEVARDYIWTAIQPPVLQLRRLLIGESERFPELSRSYYERVIAATMDALAAGFEDLVERGMLEIDDTRRAAQQFAWLVLGEPINQAMFWVDDAEVVAQDLDAIAESGARVFLAAYRRRSPS
jgi:TetR/AcrR family transcriptional repressor of mexJK operon